jgi:2-methylisocitrate lyase-like PEP mutase family enzyme
MSGFGYHRKPRPDYSLQLIPLDEMIARIEAIRQAEAPTSDPLLRATTEQEMAAARRRSVLRLFRMSA